MKRSNDNPLVKAITSLVGSTDREEHDADEQDDDNAPFVPFHSYVCPSKAKTKRIKLW